MLFVLIVLYMMKAYSVPVQLMDSALCNQTIMAVNIPGLVAVVVFYMVILIIGVWASRKSKKVEKTCTGSKSEITMVGGRNINVLVGVFTMTGRIPSFPFSIT